MDIGPFIRGYGILGFHAVFSAHSRASVDMFRLKPVWDYMKARRVYAGSDDRTTQLLRLIFDVERRMNSSMFHIRFHIPKLKELDCVSEEELAMLNIH
jgi:hypothetical protein